MANDDNTTTQSPTIGALAKALSAAQETIAPPKKGRVGKVDGTSKATGKSYEYTYNYADLADVIESYRKPLCQNGLALIQATREEGGHIVLITRLLHESGEWLTSEYPIKVYDKPQEMGSALTYARRYAVTALLGIAAEDDDDGKRAQDSKRKKPEAYKPAAPPAAESTAKPPADPLTDVDVLMVSDHAKAAGFKTRGDLLPLLGQFGGGATTLKLMDRSFLPDLLGELKRIAFPTPEQISADIDDVFGPETK